MLESAGAQILTVHGRTKEQRGARQGLADWKAIRIIKNLMSIPVIANGNIQRFEDIDACLKFTGADAVMSAEALLCNPALFANLTPSRLS
jgi:tRNA-dihydrouridine synthase 1